eukprot:scaffold15810_cov117-Isochrysis_galbana.AAC.1
MEDDAVTARNALHTCGGTAEHTLPLFAGGCHPTLRTTHLARAMAGLQRSGPQNGALVPLRPTRRHGLRQARARHPIANRSRPHRLRTYRANNNKNSPPSAPPGRTCESA